MLKQRRCDKSLCFCNGGQPVGRQLRLLPANQPASQKAFAQAFIYNLKNKEILMEGCKYFSCISSTREKETLGVQPIHLHTLYIYRTASVSTSGITTSRVIYVSIHSGAKDSLNYKNVTQGLQAERMDYKLHLFAGHTMDCTLKSFTTSVFLLKFQKIASV